MDKNKKSEILADKFIKITQNQELFPTISANVVIFTPHLSALMFGDYYKDTSMSPYLVAMKEKENSFIIVSAASMKKVAEIAFKKYWRSPESLIKNRQSINHYLRILNKIYLSCYQKKILREDLDDLRHKAKQTILANKYLNTFIWPSVYFDEDFSKQLLKQLNVNISQNRFKELWGKASVSVYESFEKRRYLNLLKLIIKKLKWEDIVEQCQYYFTTYNSVDNLQDIQRKLKKQYGHISIKQANNFLKKEQKDRNKKISVYKNWLNSLNKDERKFVIYLQEIIRSRDVRKDGVSQALTIIYRIAQRIFKEIGLSEDLIYYCSSEEISKGIKYFLKNKENIKKRPQGATMLLIYNKNIPAKFEYGTYKTTKKKLEKYYYIRQFPKEKDILEIKGQIACPGRISGKVRIIYEPQKVKKFQKGDILVTSMTRPEFVPLMQKAGAIITDEGGITSHAAIVSRELGIPCIIGTKIATKVLKDGDLVEVDAEKGIVKILRKK